MKNDDVIDDVIYYVGHLCFIGMVELDRRKRLLNLFENGVTSAQKLSEITDIPISTVYDNLRRFREGKSEIRCPGSGRKPIFDANDHRRATQLAVSHPQWSANQIAFECARKGSSLVSQWTMSRTLASCQYFKTVPQKVPLMTNGYKGKRMEWCLTHRDYNFDNVIFTDESRFQFYRCTRKRWAKFGNCQKMIPKFSPAVTVWGGMSKLGLTPLVCVTGNISSVKYCDILGEGLLNSTIATNGIPYEFQQDNATPHTSAFTRDWFRRHHVTTLEWPAASPDLNPIENVWQVMKDRVEKLQPHQIADWRATFLETWAGLSQNYIDNLVTSMPHRIEQCIERQGGLTDY